MRLSKTFSIPPSTSSALCLLAFVLVVPAGYASVLPPGGIVAPDVFTTNYPAGGYTPVADSGPEFFNLGNGDMGWVQQIVEQNTTTGYLDFLTEFAVTSGQVTALEVSDFTNAGFGSPGFPDVGYNTTACFANILATVSATCTAPPDTANAAPNLVGNFIPSVIQFNFGPPVLAGNASEVLVVETNATSFEAGTIGVRDASGGASQGLPGFQPAPEPAEAGVLLGGLFAVGLFVARKFRVQRS